MQLFRTDESCNNNFKVGGRPFTLESCMNDCSADPSCTFISFKASTGYCARYTGATCGARAEIGWNTYMKTGTYILMKFDGLED